MAGAGPSLLRTRVRKSRFGGSSRARLPPRLVRSTGGGTAGHRPSVGTAREPDRLAAAALTFNSSPTVLSSLSSDAREFTPGSGGEATARRVSGPRLNCLALPWCPTPRARRHQPLAIRRACADEKPLPPLRGSSLLHPEQPRASPEAHEPLALPASPPGPVAPVSHEAGGPSPPRGPKFTRGRRRLIDADQRRLERLLEEFNEFPPVHPQPDETRWDDPTAKDSPAHMKAALLHFHVHDIHCPTKACINFDIHSRDAFWDRIQVLRLRHQGRKEMYVVMNSVDGSRRLSTWHVPPPTFPSSAARAEHAARQAGANDDRHDRHVKGVRLVADMLRHYGCPEHEIDKVFNGHPMLFSSLPPPHRGKNYMSCIEMKERHHETMKEAYDKGYMEGPLLYTPRIVNSMGGVYKEDKDKYRVTVDGTASGINPRCVSIPTSYDMLEDVLATTVPRAWMSGFDLKDAFYHHATHVLDADFWGVQDPLTHDFWRYRFLPFGSKQAPAVQQHWANVIRKILQSRGLDYCEAGSAAASYDGFLVNGVFLDDFHCQHHPALSREDATAQYDSVLRVLSDMGVGLSVSKCTPPALRKEYIGYIIDTEQETVEFSEGRQSKLRAMVDELLRECRQPRTDPAEGMVVVDLFGGIGTSLVALMRAGIRVRKYHLCDIDPVARNIAAANVRRLHRRYPHLLPASAIEDIFELPQDVEKIDGKALRALGRVDLMLAAFPCQGLSRASRQAKGLSDARSGLFWEGVRVWKALRRSNPLMHHLFENVMFQDRKEAHFQRDFKTVCDILGQPLSFCASLVSPSRRKRNYWVSWDAKVPEARDDRDWATALRLGHGPPRVTKGAGSDSAGTFARKAPTVVRSQNTYSVRDKSAFVRDLSTGELVLPDVEEVEMMVGLAWGATEAAGVSERERREALGNVIDANALTHLMESLRPAATTSTADDSESPDFRDVTSPSRESASAAARRVPLPGVRLHRLTLASLVGKLQFCAALVDGAQVELREAYKALHSLSGDDRARSVRDQWASHVHVAATPGLIRCLLFWERALSEEVLAKPIYLAHLGCTSGFWKGLVDDSDPALDQSSIASMATARIPVITTDASGTAGGAWWQERRLYHRYSPQDAAPGRSSNWRELDTAVRALEEWGPVLQAQGHRRVLLRIDNTTAASILTKKNTRSDHLEPLLRRAQLVERRYGLEVAARHISGVANTLADRISRWKPSFSTSDWRLRRDVFEQLRASVPEFDVDATADPGGSNAHCTRFWSEADDALTHSWQKLNVWCNPPFDRAADFIKHGLTAYAQNPTQTSLTFCLPVWLTAPFWKHLAGFRVLRLFSEGSDLFSRPIDSVVEAREMAGPTRWATVIVHLPSTAPCSLHQGTPQHRGETPGGVLELPLLRGAAREDDELLSRMQPSPLQPLQRHQF